MIKGILKSIKGSGFEYEENLLTAHYISSFELLNLVAELEKAFDIRIDLDEVSLGDFDSISDIADLISKTMSDDK